MDVKTLLAMTPEDVAQAIIARRHELSEALPSIVRERRQELDHLNPMLEQALLERDKATAAVSTLKEERDSLQKQAKELRKKLTSLRETLIAEKRLKNPNPGWAKEKLATKLAEIEEKLETSALDLNSERKLLRQMRELTRSHEEWVAERIESDPGLKEYQDGWKQHHQLLKDADEAHGKLVGLAEISGEHHTKYAEHKEVHRDAQGQHNRAKSLLSTGDDIVSYWNHRITNGFDDLKDGTGDLMAASRMVAEGSPSSMPRRPPEENAGGEEE
ncbi:MAG: hypothetical protein HOE69_06360 [Euryarchaeota archaeon]|nr:hypothetical protein [Euryarchaeota archaeon]